VEPATKPRVATRRLAFFSRGRAGGEPAGGGRAPKLSFGVEPPGQRRRSEEGSSTELDAGNGEASIVRVEEGVVIAFHIHFVRQARPSKIGSPLPDSQRGPRGGTPVAVKSVRQSSFERGRSTSEGPGMILASRSSALSVLKNSSASCEALACRVSSVIPRRATEQTSPHSGPCTI
jgi:hypothetical protein